MHGINGKEDIPLEKRIFHGSSASLHRNLINPINLTPPGTDNKKAFTIRQRLELLAEIYFNQLL